MFLLLCFSCLLLASDIHASETVSESVDDVNNQKDEEEVRKFWKLIFTTYYDLKGQRNAATDSLVEEFLEHEFEPYPEELYPAFKKIFLYISKSNDRIWNLYESILYLYRNIAAADRIYETVLRRFSQGKLFKESGELDIDATFPLDEELLSQNDIFGHRSGEMFEEEPDFVLDEQPCGDECGIPPVLVGSIRALPGVHFPNYNEIPITSFTCEGKHIPGFYADLETGCQVFHVCYAHRRESFLCPTGTIFNQAILACDYYYSSNCSLSVVYYHPGPLIMDHLTEGTETFVDHLLEQYGTVDTISTETLPYVDYPIEGPGKPKSQKVRIALPNIDWTLLMVKFLPVKSKIIEYPGVCDSTTTDHPIKSTTGPLTVPEPSWTMPPVIVTPIPTAPPKKEEYHEKTGKPAILLDLLKAIEVLTKDTEGFLTKMIQKKHMPTRKPAHIPKVLTEKPKPLPEINQRFVVKPVKVRRHFPLPTVSPRKSLKLKPSKQILKSKKQDPSRRKESTKLVLEGMKAFEHLFG